MKTKNEVEQDAQRIREIVKPYMTDGCFLTIIAKEDGKHVLSFGGRADLLCMLISDAIAKVIMNMPVLSEDIIDAIADATHARIADLKKSGKVVPMRPQ